jgi:hypothetical protein
MNQSARPTNEEMLLAFLLSESENPATFYAWRQQTDLDNLPPGFFDLMPMLYARLARLGLDDPWLRRLKGIYRRAFVANQAAFKTIKEIKNQLEAQQIPVLLSGGASLAALTYPEVALRPVHLPTLTIPQAQARQALKTLAQTGWRAIRTGRLEALQKTGQRLKNEKGQAAHLRWHVLDEIPHPAADADFWNLAQPATLNGDAFLVLPAEEQFLFACLARYQDGPLAVLDAWMLAQARPLSWPKLEQYAAQYGFHLPVRQMLASLASNTGLEIPSDLLARLHNHIPGPLEVILERIGQIEPARRGLPARLVFRLLRAGQAWARTQKLKRA